MHSFSYCVSLMWFGPLGFYHLLPLERYPHCFPCLVQSSERESTCYSATSTLSKIGGTCNLCGWGEEKKKVEQSGVILGGSITPPAVRPRKEPRAHQSNKTQTWRPLVTPRIGESKEREGETEKVAKTSQFCCFFSFRGASSTGRELQQVVFMSALFLLAA